MSIAPAAIFAVTTYTLSEAVLALRRRAAKGSAGGDQGSLPLLWLSGVASIFIAFAISGPPAAIGDVPLLRQIPAIGLGVFFAGLSVRWYAIRYLGPFFTVDVAIVKDHRLVDTGPYRWLRHPSYSGLLLEVAGLGLCLGNVWSLLIVVAVSLISLLWRIGIEEQTLRAAFGPAYETYAARTKRLVPYVF